MDDLKAATDNVETAHTINDMVKKFSTSVRMINNEKSAIQLNTETPLQESLNDIPRQDETTYKYLGFEMKKGEVERNEFDEETSGEIKEKYWKTQQRGTRYLS